MFTLTFMLFEESIEEEQTNIKNIHKNLDHQRLQLEKLNRYIYKETDTKNNLEKGYQLSVNKYIEDLKVAYYLVLLMLKIKKILIW